MGRSKKWSKSKKHARSQQLSTQTQVYSGTVDDLQLPGFVYDSKLRRYFRIPRAGDVPGLLPANLSAAPVVHRVLGMHRLNVCRLLQERQVLGPSASFGHVVGEHELRSISQKYIRPMHRFDDVNCVCLAGGGPDDIGMAGMLTHGNSRMLFSLELVKDCIATNRGYRIPKMYITRKLPNEKYPSVEVLEIGLMKNQRHEFVLGTCQSTSAEQQHCLDIYSLDGSNIGYLPERSRCWSHLDSVKKLNLLALSVAFDEAAELLAVGGEGRVCLLRKYGTNVRTIIHLKRENAHSVCFVDDGRGLLVGTHHGYIYRCDFRSPSTCLLKVNTGRHLLCHLKSCDDDDRMIVCSGFDDYLAMVDLRACRQAVQYDEHVNRGRKVIASINRFGMDAVSCTGYDGRTRIWNLMTGGQPVVTFDPPPNYVTNRPVHSVLLRPWSAEAVVVVAYANNIYVHNA